MMRRLTVLLAAGALIATGGVAQAREKLTGEQRLAKMLEGREAGKPNSCIPSWDTRDMTIIDNTAIVYSGGSTIWVNRPANPNQLDNDDILVTHPTGGQLCKLDIVTTIDRVGGFTTGIISLSDFVPYRKVAKKD